MTATKSHQKWKQYISVLEQAIAKKQNAHKTGIGGANENEDVLIEDQTTANPFYINKISTPNTFVQIKQSDLDKQPAFIQAEYAMRTVLLKHANINETFNSWEEFKDRYHIFWKLLCDKVLVHDTVKRDPDLLDAAYNKLELFMPMFSVRTLEEKVFLASTIDAHFINKRLSETIWQDDFLQIHHDMMFSKDLTVEKMEFLAHMANFAEFTPISDGLYQHFPTTPAIISCPRLFQHMLQLSDIIPRLHEYIITLKNKIDERRQWYDIIHFPSEEEAANRKTFTNYVVWYANKIHEQFKVSELPLPKHEDVLDVNIINNAELLRIPWYIAHHVLLNRNRDSLRKLLNFTTVDNENHNYAGSYNNDNMNKSTLIFKTLLEKVLGQKTKTYVKRAFETDIKGIVRELKLEPELKKYNAKYGDKSSFLSKSMKLAHIWNLQLNQKDQMRIWFVNEINKASMEHAPAP